MRRTRVFNVFKFLFCVEITCILTYFILGLNVWSDHVTNYTSKVETTKFSVHVECAIQTRHSSGGDTLCISGFVGGPGDVMFALNSQE